MSAAAVREAIMAAASENTDLLVKLSSTSDAPSIFQAHNIRLTHLREAVTAQTSELANIKEEVESNSKKHKKYRNSVTRRFYYRVTNKSEEFQAKATNAESAYFSKLAAQSKAEERLENLRRDYHEASEAQKPLEAAAKEHEETHGKIDKLYDRLFTGPTPGFPKEDQREHTFYEAKKRNENTKERILGARRAMRVLEVAQTSVARATTRLGVARVDAQDSWLFLDDTIFSLRQSDERISHALLAVERAEEHLQPLTPEMTALKKSIVADFGASTSISETFYSKKSILAAIKATEERLSGTKEKIKELIQLAKAREQEGLEQIKITARSLEDSRQELEFHRRSLFERVAGFGEAAPAYNECCDRADGFCVVAQDTHDHEHEIDQQLEQMPTGDAPNYEELVNRYRPRREELTEEAPTYPVESSATGSSSVPVSGSAPTEQRTEVKGAMPV